MRHHFLQNNQVKIVNTFSELVNAVFEGENNALCWYRNLDGDFKEVATKLVLKENITEISTDDLLSLTLTEQGIIARDIILNDFKLLEENGSVPNLNLIKCYEQDDEFDFIATDVYSFHVDRSPISSDTFLCTYFGAASDIVPNNQCKQKVLIPEIRQQLKAMFDGPDDLFESFLKDNFFDLHYQPDKNAAITNLGLGHIWRLSVDHPNQQVPPCIHRAPIENAGENRLLLIC